MPRMQLGRLVCRRSRIATSRVPIAIQNLHRKSVSDCCNTSKVPISMYQPFIVASSKGKKTSSAVPPQQETQARRLKKKVCLINFENSFCFQMSQSGIFEKLASLGSEHNRKYFLSQLFSFMNVNCTPIKVMPVVCRQTVDLYRLYNIVKEFGGLEKVRGLDGRRPNFH